MRTDGDWIGVKCHVHEMSLEADLEMHIGRNGYVGLARVENQIVNVCGLFRKQKGVGGKDALFQCLRIGGLIRLADRISRARPDPNSFCAVAGFQTGRQAGPPFSIGDASQMIPPFTGNGMSMAFESAECALDPLLAFASGKISWKAAAESSSDAQSRRFSRRMRAAGHLHSLILTRPGLVSIFARNRLIPSRLLLRILRW